MSRGGAAVALIGALCLVAPLAVAPLAVAPSAAPWAPAAHAAEPGPGRDAASARAEARRILQGRRYTGTQVRGPFRGALEWLGRQLDRLGDLVPSLDRRIPGGRLVTWIVLLALVAAIAWAAAQQAARRRTTAAVATAERSGEGGRERPGAVERRAEQAERDGDYATAVRLRFHAGLLRLDDRGVIEYRPSLGTAVVARRLCSRDFERLAHDFDEVVYGGREATASDAEAARDGWAAVAKVPA